MIARRGIASRRKSADIIKQGKVRVNDKVIFEAGYRITDKDIITINGKLISDKPETITIMLNKPRGFICSSSAIHGKTIFSLTRKIDTRIVNAGRLDKESEGLLILSNDGNLINMLTHPSYNKNKIYKAEVMGPVTKVQIAKLRSRLTIDSYKIRPVKVRLINSNKSSSTLEFTLKEGRNRQIRKMCTEAGLKINHLIRTKINNLELGVLKSGKYKILNATDLSQLSG